MSKHEDKSPSWLWQANLQAALTMPNRVDWDINLITEITRPHVKCVDTGLVLAICGDQATLPDDNTEGYDPCNTGTNPVSPQTRPTPIETKKKELYPYLYSPAPSLSLTVNTVDIAFSQWCGTSLYIDQITTKCFVNSGPCAVPECNSYIHYSYEGF